MISIISVFDDKTLLESYLLKSLKNQSMDYELVLLDNSNDKFISASEALNYGGYKAKGDYLMFVHQDFGFDSDKWLKDLVEILDKLENLGVAGVAGRYDRNTISNIKTGITPEFAGSIQIKEPIKVQTIDECLFIVPKELFEKIQFDEDTCDNWHLYATDYCLSAQKAGYDVYVLPLGGYHASPGFSFSEDEYYSILKKLVKKHKADYRWIHTTTGSWSTIFPLFLQIAYQKLYYGFGFH